MKKWLPYLLVLFIGAGVGYTVRPTPKATTPDALSGVTGVTVTRPLTPAKAEEDRKVAENGYSSSSTHLSVVAVQKTGLGAPTTDGERWTITLHQQNGETVWLILNR